MKVSVTKELKLPGSAGKASLSEKWDNISYGSGEVAFAGPVNVDCEWIYDGKGFNVSGAVKTELNAQCSRCAADFILPVGIGFSERFEKSEPEDDEKEIYIFSGEELDLTDMVTDTILLNMPLYPVCKEDCKGLCPTCGCNLNTVQCSCSNVKEEEDSNPFAGLKALFEEDKEV